jgi:uncharacterized protein YecE (DUF72 family)
MNSLPLFDADPEPEAFDRNQLKSRLTALAERRIYIGGSSWKYEGWLGQIYSRENYQVRGRFSKKLFDETCLRKYAGVFPTVCGDFAFYQFPTTAFWEKLFRQTAGSGAPGRPFRWGFKVPEQITVPVWPLHPRYGAQAGRENPAFLDADLFRNSFLRPIETWREQVGVLIFEFGTLRQRAFESVTDFVRALDPFLDRLPSGWRYAVEIRNAEFLTPNYLACLSAHGVTHVYNSWTRMPDLADQIAIPESRTTDLLVARALLKKGRPYEEAVAKFAPYTQVQEVNEPVRKALREIIDIALVDGVPAFVFVNNRLEGNSPGTIITITE